jgi:hypothetical protein
MKLTLYAITKNRLDYIVKLNWFERLISKTPELFKVSFHRCCWGQWYTDNTFKNKALVSDKMLNRLTRDYRKVK